MRACNRRIGFDDTRHMLVLIPLLSALIPVVFFGARFNDPKTYNGMMFLQTFLVTAVIWTGNRWILIAARSRYPDFADVRRRLLVQSTGMLLYTVSATTLLTIGLGNLCAMMAAGQRPLSPTDHIISANTTSLFCTLLVAALYESHYFMNELRRSVEEKERLKRERLSAQLDALRTQINPHFLFNNLNTLIALIPEEPAQAVTFVQQLAKVYRHILELKDEAAVPLRDELAVLRSYAFLLETRFGQNLRVTVDIPEAMLAQRVAPLSLQLLMENAIKHNVVSERHPLFIHVYADNGRLVMRNNLQPRQGVVESVGLGLENLRRRAALLSERLVEIQEGPAHFHVAIPLLES